MFVVVCKLFNSVLCVLLVALTIISRVRHGDHNINICYSLGVRFGFEFLSLKARVTEVISILCQQLFHQWCVTLFVNMGVILFNNAFLFFNPTARVTCWWTYHSWQRKDYQYSKRTRRWEPETKRLLGWTVNDDYGTQSCTSWTSITPTNPCVPQPSIPVYYH